MSELKLMWEHAMKTARNELHRHPLIKFLAVASVFIIYTCFATLKYGVREGLHVSILSWSFFVLCTPVADAGFLLDLPLRLLTGIRMLYSEMIVWCIAITLNIVTTLFAPETYKATILLSLFSEILHQPIPYWAIILLSAIGTFVSITFGDELLDIALKKREKRKHHRLRTLFVVCLFVLTFILYGFVLKGLGISIP